MYIIFDLDGTLIDSSKGIYQAFCLSLSGLSLAPPSYSSFKPLIGPTADVIFSKLYPDASADSKSIFYSTFRSLYDSTHYKYFSLYHGVHAMLESLAHLDFTMSVITNKPSQPSKSLISSTPGLTGMFTDIIGADYFASSLGIPRLSKKNLSLLYLFEKNQLSPSQAIYIGDTPSDMIAAQQTQCNFIPCTYGYGFTSSDSFTISASSPSLIPLCVSKILH